MTHITPLPLTSPRLYTPSPSPPFLPTNPTQPSHEVVQIHIHIPHVNTHTTTFTLPRPLLLLFAPRFAEQFQGGNSITLTDIASEYFDVFVGWIRSCWSRDGEG